MLMGQPPRWGTKSIFRNRMTNYGDMFLSPFDDWISTEVSSSSHLQQPICPDWFCISFEGSSDTSKAKKRKRHRRKIPLFLWHVAELLFDPRHQKTTAAQERTIEFVERTTLNNAVSTAQISILSFFDYTLRVWGDNHAKYFPATRNDELSEAAGTKLKVRVLSQVQGLCRCSENRCRYWK